MASRTGLLKLVKGLRWAGLRSEIGGAGDLLGWRDERGRNLLHLCCSVNVGRRGLDPSDSVRTVDVLIDAGLSVGEPAFREGDFEATPLWFCIAFGDNLPLARHLLERGSSPQHCLWAAVNRDNAAAIRLLIESGADDPTNDEGSPLLAAVDWNKPAAAEALLELGADPDHRDRTGQTPLHHALKKRRDTVFLRMLVAHGARGDLADADGVTALDLMKRRRDPEIRALIPAVRRA